MEPFSFLPKLMVSLFFNTFTVHYALSNGAVDQVIDTILNFQPSSARGFDKRGWTP